MLARDSRQELGVMTPSHGSVPHPDGELLRGTDATQEVHVGPLTDGSSGPRTRPTLASDLDPEALQDVIDQVADGEDAWALDRFEGKQLRLVRELRDAESLRPGQGQ